ncbi:MAG TPA: DUF6265 family protein [Gemmatimonadaceae bacterium]|nr:DUF6265 family protein [Gemmatimonadaceae bacterium]
MSFRALTIASLVGTLLQVVMVVAGHSSPAIKGLFAVGGMGLSLIAGVIYARLAGRTTKGSAALGGLAAGAICAFLGILVSHLLGDVPASLLALGTISSAVTGAIGGLLGALGAGRAVAVAIVGSLVATVPAAATHAQAPPTLAAASEVRGDTSVSLRDFSWLAGQWEGTVSSLPGSVADVTFSSPRAGIMTGMMRLVLRDTVLVVELISLVETPRGLEMRFRHFSSALDAYEREFKQTMRLTKHEPGSDTFENTVAYDAKLMSTQPRRSTFVRTGTDAYIGRSDIIGADGKAAEIVAQYRRREAPR